MATLPPRPPSGVPPLPPGWTEHKAPTGHTYYYHKETNTSTYTRPVAQAQNFQQPLSVSPPVFSPPVTAPNGGFPTPYSYNPTPQNFFLANNFGQQQHHGLHHAGTQHHPRGGPRGGHHGFPDRRRQPEDRPKHRYNIPNCAPWVLVKTKLKRRFVWNKETNESFWKFPQDVMKAVIEFDRMEREKKERRMRGEPSEDEDNAMEEAGAEAVATQASPKPTAGSPTEEKVDKGYDSEEYEEVEVTDDEDEENPSKRQRTDEPAEDQPLEMTEDDIAWQLTAMEEGYEEEEESLPLTEDDCKALFRDLLEDARINPYSPWDKVLEVEALFDDDRYKALPTMKARKECWDEWARDKIHLLKELRAKQEKRDPKIPYMAFLQNYATPKLFWPEFRRKYKKEPEMKDAKLSDKDREKLYREHINRLKLPQSTLKSDLSALLKAQPIATLNRSTTLETLPPSVLTDIRFISLPVSLRDSLVEAYISTLPPAPEGAAQSAQEEAEAAKRRTERERREKALADRERRVKEAQKKQQRDLEYGKHRLREEEEELQRAMRVGKGGLKAQLGAFDDEEEQRSGG